MTSSTSAQSLLDGQKSFPRAPRAPVRTRQAGRVRRSFHSSFIHFENAEKMSRSQDTKVYVGNLGRNGDKDELWSEFSKYGKVRDVWVAQNPPGFAFVEFEEPLDAADAVRELDGRSICGRTARVEISHTRSRGGGGRGGGGGRRFGGGGRDSYKSDSYRDDDYDRRSPPQRRRSPPRSRARSPAQGRYRRSRSRSPLRH